MVACTPWQNGSRFIRRDSGSFQQGSRRMPKRPKQRISRAGLDNAYRHLVCGTLRKCSASYVGDHILGFLETGEVMLKNPTRKHFASITRQLRAWGYKTNWKQLERAYFRTCVLSPDRYRAMLRLLSIFAQHLSILSNQLVVRRERDESANMSRARQFIEDHQAEPLSLGRIAQVANISRHYFCKMFKKATGINFIDHLSRVRVEKSKTLLLNPNSRISEVAFACGFQSMTNFNRAFKRIVRRSPTQFRESLPKLRRPV